MDFFLIYAILFLKDHKQERHDVQTLGKRMEKHKNDPGHYNL